MMERDIVVQTQQFFPNVKAVLEEAGMTFDDVVKTTVFLANMEDFPSVASPTSLWENGGGTSFLFSGSCLWSRCCSLW
jgi:enamine deaminase RidA (YjgF/YER057c/UK114 family)